MRARKIILTLVTLMTMRGLTHAQDEFSTQSLGRGKYSFILYLSGGPSYYISRNTAPDFLHPDVSRLGYTGTARLMWQPDHLLKLGLESGLIRFYSYRLKDAQNHEGTLVLDAIPVLVEWSMNLGKRWNIYAGSGAYLLKTRLDYQGKANTTKFSAGYTAGASYIQPLSARLGLGMEAKWLYASEATNGMITAQVQLAWRFLEY